MYWFSENVTWSSEKEKESCGLSELLPSLPTKLSGCLQSAISLFMDCLLIPSELVSRADIADGAVKAHFVVVGDEVSDKSTRFIEA